MMRHQTRRGSIAAVLIIVLVVLTLATVGMVLAGARDQDMTAHRLDTVRAFYAAEAGANMAIREIMHGADADGDGGVGTISDDGNAANDPSLGPARVLVTGSTAGGETALSAVGRSGSCIRQAEAVSTAGSGASGGGSTTVMAVFGRGGSKTPRYSVWSGSAWGPNTAFPWSAGNNVYTVVARACPVRNEVLFACIDSGDDATAAVWNGASWSSPTVIAANIARERDRPIDVAYESVSGRAMIAYWNDTAGQFGYRIWNGSSWISETLMTGSGSDHSHFLALVPRPGTDEILLLANDHDSQTRLLAKVWNGSSWSTWTTISTSLAANDKECFAGAWERSSGRAMIVYGESSQNQPRYRTWDGSSWSSASLLPSIGHAPVWVRLAAEEGSNRVLFAATDTSNDLETNVWSGSAWGGNQQLVDDTGGNSRRRFDIMFEPGTNEALVLYRHKNKSYPAYRTWNGSAWSSELDGPNIAAKPEYVALSAGAISGELLVCVADSKDDLHLARWSVSGLSAGTEIETSLSSSAQEPVCMVGSSSTRTAPRIVSWTEVEP